MRNVLRILPVLAVAAFLAGCEGPCSKIDVINGPVVTSGSADFSSIASVGTSISAGYQSGGLVNRHQVHAFPALFAARVGRTVLSDGTGDYSFNALDGWGYGPLPSTFTIMQLQSFSPLVISNSGHTPGNWLNDAQAADFNNLSVPSQLAADLVDSTFYGFGATPVHGATYIPFFDHIYRHRGLGLQQLIRCQPTFVTFELGANEVLGSATEGVSTKIFPVSSYVAAVRTVLNSLHAALPNTNIAVFNVPSVTSIPYCTTFSPVTISLVTNTPVALIGPGGTPLTPTSLVLLTAKDLIAAGTGIPVDGYNYLNPAVPGNGQPLPDAVVLDDAEQAALNAATFGMNAALDSIVANRPWTTKVDLNGLLGDIAANGFTVGSATYTTDFVTGGLFSLDGIHPNDLSHAIICNALIDAVNAKWGSTIPHLVVTDYATPTSSRARPAAGGIASPSRIDRITALFSSAR